MNPNQIPVQVRVASRFLSEQSMKSVLRQGNTQDVNFIFSAWLKSFRQNPWVRSAPNPVYFKHHHDLIERTLSKGVVIVACAEDDPEHILGFAVYERRGEIVILHYVYVKQPYRRMKIAAELLNVVPQIDFFTHHSGQVHPRLQECGAVYDPYLFLI